MTATPVVPCWTLQNTSRKGGSTIKPKGVCFGIHPIINQLKQEIMEKFRFKQDVKITVWVRQSFEIEAENKEEVLEKVEQFKTVDVTSEIDNVECETLWDTQELMWPEENDNQCTIELYDDHGNLIGKNAD